MTEGQILRTIEALQATRQYADEIESARLAAKIEKLLKELEHRGRDVYLYRAASGRMR